MSKQNISSSNDQLAECHGLPLLDLNQSVWDMFLSTAIKYPQRTAVVSLWQPKLHLENLVRRETETSLKGGELTEPEFVLQWNYEELLKAVEVLTEWLQRQGCLEGQTLVTFLWNSAEWVLFFWAAARLRMTFVPLDPRTLEQTADEYIRRLRPSLLVVQDEAAVDVLDRASPHLRDVKVRISCTTSPSESWTSLCTLPSHHFDARPFEKGSTPGQELALIVFTSGTTSTPKGCPHTAENIWSASFDFDPDKDKNMIEKWLVHTPVSHIFAINNTLRSFRYGGTIVFPSKAFDIHASLKALELHQCTRMAAVPTLVQGLLSLPSFPGKERLALHYVTLAGTLIKDEDVRMCKRFGSDAVIQAYGMSEGAPTMSWLRDDPFLESGHYPGVGKVLPGCRMRVCLPESREVVNRNVPGELHIGGTSVISGYLDGADPEAFYTDEYGSWLRTGDQATIDENGAVQILGRYKDLIIRGGENIAPVKIEECLGQVAGLYSQVVGLPDFIAGEVPVAVVQSLKSSSKADIMRLVEHLGPSYALAAVTTLEELSIEQYPMTPAGKVRKNILKDLVAKHFGIASNEPDKRTSPPEDFIGPLTPPTSEGPEEVLSVNLEPLNLDKESTEVDETTKQLMEIWATLVISAPSKDDPIFDFADSITLLRYCDKVWRSLGKKLYLQDFIVHDTVERQAQLLQSRDAATKDSEGDTSVALSASEMARKKNGPPGVADMVHVNGDPRRFIDTRLATSRVLKGLGLSWEADVEDVLPIKASFWAFAHGPRPQSFRHRIAFRIDGRSPENIRKALEKGLSSRPMFRTILVRLPDTTPIHVVVRPGKTLYDILITEKAGLDEATIRETILDDSGESFSSIQMFQAVVAPCQDSTTLILTYNHSVFDAMSMVPWMRDLDMLVNDPNMTLLALTPFKLFADMVYSHQESMPATLDVQYFVKRFSGVNKQTKAFWPPQRAPGWMIATDQDSEHRAARMKVRKAEPIRYPRVVTKSKIPHMTALKAMNVQPVNVVKTAIALFNIQQTGQEYAFFNNLDAGRSWPFMPAWIPLPPAMSIDGPTMEWTGNMIRILPGETVEHLLNRIRDDQEELSLHAHAPLFRVLDSLGTEGPFVMDALLRQSFNWDISLQYLNGNKYGNVDLTTLKLIERVDWPDGGFFWEAGMLSADELCVLATWDDAQLSLAEAEGHVESLNKIIQWITTPENWVKPVGKLLKVLYDIGRKD
ncbi:related to long-chain-fatty-acid-CoA ligase [Phialocephala subalpina]|uniref:Related to long-chain-fatty-acid-CoA ligase n=1 Tax=Phialocephala subalpina TaxID=576137 RepID=A0A1L7XWE5_9HELO|nr:related to long-chain-fatty-acid-CoA ligase [Phialocephala subalpina]